MSHVKIGAICFVVGFAGLVFYSCISNNNTKQKVNSLSELQTEYDGVWEVMALYATESHAQGGVKCHATIKNENGERKNISFPFYLFPIVSGDKIQLEVELKRGHKIFTPIRVKE